MTPHQNRRVFFVLATLLVLRLAAMIVIPLNDTTEARYGEMARRMLETGNWVTPMHAAGVPFLAKPPLWAWMSAASMGVFGVNEGAARLPALLLSLLTLGLVWVVMKKQRGAEEGRDAALVLATAGGFFASAGTVMTDPALAFSTTLILTSFWLAPRPDSRGWRWMFFVGCGIGLLAKGPVALVGAGLPVFFWTLLRRDWKNLWARLPWIRGSALTLLIAAPWYLLAELRTPGFLDYFLIGENVRRFVDSGWTGDQYGYAHAFPFGMIWVFALLCFLPWSGLIPTALCNAFPPRRKPGSTRGFVACCLLKANNWIQAYAGMGRGRSDDGWLLFLALWGVAPLVFFTFAANIIWPYPLPALPGLALLFVEWRRRAEKPLPPAALWLTPLAGALALAVFLSAPERFDHSQKDMIALWRAQNPQKDSRLLFWGYKYPEFSAAFYSGGTAATANDAASLRALTRNGTRDHVVVTQEAFAQLPPGIQRRFEEAGRLENGKGVRILLREKQLVSCN